MTQGQQLPVLTATLLQRLDTVIQLEKPDTVLVHGDTITALAAAMAAFFRHIPVGHVEAGLRTYDLYNPWPEEMNRHTIDLLSSYYFAPTEASRKNLLQEHMRPGWIYVTGNTVIDALMITNERIQNDPEIRQNLGSTFSFLDPYKRLILITSHRRENHGENQEEKCKAIKYLSTRPDVQILFTVHPNPRVKKTIETTLGINSNVHLLEPQDYFHFVYLMNKSYFIITDSGGIQEEAPALGKPVLVTRETTERPEALEAGTIKLVGTKMKSIVTECERLLSDGEYYQSIASSINPYGDGTASEKIVEILLQNEWNN